MSVYPASFAWPSVTKATGPIPSLARVVMQTGKSPCHRAITEAAQARATYIAGSRDDVGLSEYNPRQRQRRRIQGLQQFKKHRPVQRFEAVDAFDNEHIDDDLDLCLRKLKAVGIEEIVAVDLTKPEFGLAVTKVVIPGLEGAFGHWHSSYIPGPRAKALMNLPFDID